jgi:hypothetical protein
LCRWLKPSHIDGRVFKAFFCLAAAGLAILPASYGPRQAWQLIDLVNYFESPPSARKVDASCASAIGFG